MAFMERILGAELTHPLGYAAGKPKPAAQPNHRNGTTPKTVVTEDGAIPRDRAGSFAPQLVPKGVRRLPRFDQNVLSLLRPRDERRKAASTWKTSTWWRSRPT